jgi:hypothetical protein
MSLKIFGQLSSSRVSTLDGMTRNTPAAPRFWLKALTGSAQVGDLEGEVGLEELLVLLALGVVHDVVDHAVHILVGQAGRLIRRTSPWTRIMGGRPPRCAGRKPCS